MENTNENNNNKSQTNGWDVNAKLVLNELERLNDKYEAMNNNVRELRELMIKNNNEQLHQWKDNINNVVSVSELAEMKKDVSDLKNFKIKGTVIFGLIQFAIVTIIGIWGKLK